MRQILFRTLFVALFLSALVGGIFSYWAWQNARETRVVFLDVGQGDAILISQGGNQILIDGGRSGKLLLSRLSRYVPFWDRTIETVITTHPDADHIGGLPDLVKNYQVRTFISTNAESSSDVFKLLQDRLGEGAESPERIEADKGLAVSLPGGGVLRVLYPYGSLAENTESNAGSMVTRFSYRETDFLLAGDLPHEETFLPDVPESEILKLSHHGSKYSSDEKFLTLVKPKEAIVSVGQNTYGHPAAETLARVAATGAIIRRTDVSGDLSYRCSADLDGCVFSGASR
ncbi:MAG: MBL fold metallo-hydrolase [Candidatus Moraniibacteriota bacterium]